MQLINKNISPDKTIYYISVIIYKELKEATYSVKKLYENLEEKSEDIDYSSYLYALNFLYLIEKITLDKDVIKLC